MGVEERDEAKAEAAVEDENEGEMGEERDAEEERPETAAEEVDSEVVTVRCNSSNSGVRVHNIA